MSIQFKIKKLCIFLVILIFQSEILFTVSAKVWVVDNKNTESSDLMGYGTKLRPFKSISFAAQLAEPGDTVLVHEGIYRECISPEKGGKAGQPVVYLAAHGEKVVVKGSEVWKDQWLPDKQYSGVYRSRLDQHKLENYNPYIIPLADMTGRLVLGELFVDGERYTQVDSLRDVAYLPGTWTVSYDLKEIWIHPAGVTRSINERFVEYTVRERIFSPRKRGLGYIEVNGFVFEQCANQFPGGFYMHGSDGHPQAGAVSTKAGHHWIIRNNKISYAKSIAIDCGYGGLNEIADDKSQDYILQNEYIGYHLIENNFISDCGTGGIAGAFQRSSIIRNNTIENCNYMNLTAPETGAIKVHFFFDGLIEGNLIRNNNCCGIWLDNQWYGTRVTRNIIIESLEYGIFVELGSGPCLVDNNIIAYSKIGDGIYLHDASGVTIAHNLLYANQHFGVYARIVSDRPTINFAGKEEIAGTHNLTILNNIFIDNYRGHICLPLKDGTRVYDNHSDFNLFINGAFWQWEGLAYNNFTLGSNGGRISPHAMSDSLWSAFDNYHYPDSLRPERHNWEKQPLLELEWWQMLTGNDTHSFSPLFNKGEVENGAIEMGAITFSPYYPMLEIKNGYSFIQMKCPAVKQIDSDLYKIQHQADSVYPGPFSVYHKGFNRFYLRPFK